MTEFTPEKIKARFDELAKIRQPLIDKREKLWAELDGLVSGETDLSVKDAKAREAIVRDGIKALHAQLAPLDAEYAICARALGSKRIEAPTE